MLKIKNLFENSNIKVIEQKGNISILEYAQDKSVTPQFAAQEYFASRMNIRKRQAFIELKGEGFVISSGAMQWMAGNVTAGTDIKGVGDFLGKALKGSVSKESAVKPKYSGEGCIMLEPTYKYLLVEDIGSWGSGMVIEDGMFLGCQDSIKQKIQSRKSISSAVLGNEGLFNLCLAGEGYAVLESPVPREELIEVMLKDDVLKVDGSFAVAWSSSLEFTVERTTKTLTGSAVSGEGLVNVYRGTGKVLMAPIQLSNQVIKKPEQR